MQLNTKANDPGSIMLALANCPPLPEIAAATSAQLPIGAYLLICKLPGMCSVVSKRVIKSNGSKGRIEFFLMFPQRGDADCKRVHLASVSAPRLSEGMIFGIVNDALIYLEA